jgi:hypothetical protein
VYRACACEGEGLGELRSWRSCFISWYVDGATVPDYCWNGLECWIGVQTVAAMRLVHALVVADRRLAIKMHRLRQ